MSIQNFGDLKTAVGVWMDRNNLAAYIPDFISLAATRIYYGSKDALLPSEPVRTKSMQFVDQPTVANATFSLPARYLSTILLEGDDGGSGQTLEYVAPTQFSRYANSGQVPQKYTILNNSIYLSGSGSQTLNHHYYRSFPAFVNDADTNDLLTTAPGLWLHAALIEGNSFIGDDDATKKAHRMYSAIVTGLNEVADEYPGGSLAVRAR